MVVQAASLVHALPCSVRAGALSTTGQSTNFVLPVDLPLAPGDAQDKWVLRGAALLCQLNT